MEPFWESFRLDPRLPRNASMRASDADREIVRGLLGEAYADGRLSREEYDERTAALLGSRTLGELPGLVSDLVAADPVPAVPPRTELRERGVAKYRTEVAEAFGGFAFVSLVCIVIWLVTGGVHHFFWPVFPVVVTGGNLVKTAVNREAIIEREVRRLEKKAARELEPGRHDGASPDDGDGSPDDERDER
ncbi:DUF1707 domain-containing protein [Nocardioides sp. KR10-350]|uniref:DUF1707 SHOCT-like domain-containing protein n=1 Tax=Nocardioides cheoyonin TaxID=3156615 RepID=UPI0032B5CCFB